MTTETRTVGSPERDVWIATRERGIDAEPPAGSTECEARRDHHRDEKLPDPRGPPLRHPEAREEAERGERDGAARKTEDQEDAEAELRRRLQRCGDRGVPGHETHDRLPCERRAALLDVVADQAGVARGRVEVLAEVLEEHPDEHRPEHEAEDREQRQRFGRGGAHGSGYLDAEHGRAGTTRLRELALAAGVCSEDRQGPAVHERAKLVGAVEPPA